jgi:hypothetical protein
MSGGSVRAALFTCLLILATASSQVSAQESLFDSIAKGAGLATDVAPPPDFVVVSRPTEPPTPIPVFGTPVEPPSSVKSPTDLKTMDADLERSGKKHDALRSAFPPSAKAMAAAEAARKAKSAKKPVPMPTN